MFYFLNQRTLYNTTVDGGFLCVICIVVSGHAPSIASSFWVIYTLFQMPIPELELILKVFDICEHLFDFAQLLLVTSCNCLAFKYLRFFL